MYIFFWGLKVVFGYKFCEDGFDTDIKYLISKIVVLALFTLYTYTLTSLMQHL